MPTLEGFRAYAKIDADDSDPSIESCYQAALQHARDTGVPEFLFTLSEEGDPKLNLYINALALYFYDNRSPEQMGQELPGQLIRMRRELTRRREVTAGE